jgi:hypothetical protein
MLYEACSLFGHKYIQKFCYGQKKCVLASQPRRTNEFIIKTNENLLFYSYLTFADDVETLRQACGSGGSFDARAYADTCNGVYINECI